MKYLLLSLIAALALPACGGAACGNETTSAPRGDAPAAGIFMISNQSTAQICSAFISAHSDYPNWGEDQLGLNTIPVGTSYEWAAGAAVWDVRLQDCEHNTVYENTEGIDIRGGGTVLTVTDSSRIITPPEDANIYHPTN